MCCCVYNHRPLWRLFMIFVCPDCSLVWQAVGTPHKVDGQAWQSPPRDYGTAPQTNPRGRR